MKDVLLIGNTGGIAHALQQAFEVKGARVTGLSRRVHGFDLRDEAVVTEQLSNIETQFDIVFVATGALVSDHSRPEKSMLQVSQAALIEQFTLNAVGPMLCLLHAKRLLKKEGNSIFAALSARVGSIGDNRLGGWYSYRASKAALNQLIHTGAIELQRTHPNSICVALHPGTVRTPLTSEFAKGHPTVSPQDAAENLLRVLDSLSPSQSGQFFDWAGKAVQW